MWYVLIDGHERHLFSPWGAYAGSFDATVHKPGDDVLITRMMNGGAGKVVYRVTR